MLNVGPVFYRKTQKVPNFQGSIRLPAIIREGERQETGGGFLQCHGATCGYMIEADQFIEFQAR